MHKIFKKDIFISHSSHNAVIAEQLGAFLKNIGISSDEIFCSSVLGQGVNNGEKLNEAIFKAIKGAKIIIYILSQEFLKSSYCIEELGAGWYLSSDKQTCCYYLRVPDMELSELQGFVNSKIDKFSLINCSEDLILLVENICHALKIKVPKLTEITSNVRSFLSAINDECDKCVITKAETERNKNERVYRIEQLEQELKHKDTLINDTKRALQLEKEQKKKNELENELRVLDVYIGRLANVSCISSENIKKINKKGFWFDIVYKYKELLQKLEIESYSYELERLVAQIFIAYGDNNNGYIHFKLAMQDKYYVPFHDIDEFVKDYPFSLSEVISMLKKKVEELREGNEKDLTTSTINELEKRETRLITASKTTTN